MNTTEIVKAGIIGGVISIVIELVVGFTALSIAYDVGFIAMLLGAGIAGWMIKGKMEDAVVSGVLVGLIYVILGVFILFSLFTRYHPNPISAVVVGIVLGAIGGFAGNYLASHQGSAHQGSAKPSRKKK